MTTYSELFVQECGNLPGGLLNDLMYLFLSFWCLYSGAEDVALIEYAHLTGRPFCVFSLDTGRLNPET